MPSAGARSGIGDICTTRDGLFVVSSQFQEVFVWSLPSGTFLHTIEAQNRVRARICTTPDSRSVVVAADSLTEWDLQDGRARRQFVGAPSGAGTVKWVGITGRDRLLCAYIGSYLVFWDLTTGLRLKCVSHAVPTHAICTPPTAAPAAELTELVTCTRQVTVGWSISQPTTRGLELVKRGTFVQSRNRLAGRGENILAVCMSHDGRYLVTGASSLEMWLCGNGMHLRSMHSRGRVVGLEFSPDDNLLVTASIGGVLMWGMPGGCLLRKVGGDTLQATGMSLTPDGRRVVVARATSSGGELEVLSLWKS